MKKSLTLHLYNVRDDIFIYRGSTRLHLFLPGILYIFQSLLIKRKRSHS